MVPKILGITLVHKRVQQKDPVNYTTFVSWLAIYFV